MGTYTRLLPYVGPRTPMRTLGNVCNQKVNRSMCIFYTCTLGTWAYTEVGCPCELHPSSMCVRWMWNQVFWGGPPNTGIPASEDRLGRRHKCQCTFYVTIQRLFVCRCLFSRSRRLSHLDEEGGDRTSFRWSHKTRSNHTTQGHIWEYCLGLN